MDTFRALRHEYVTYQLWSNIEEVQLHTLSTATEDVQITIKHSSKFEISIHALDKIVTNNCPMYTKHS